ncbi:MAG: deoxyribonuclease IV [Chloroflexota bacterium]|nr:deoxyribonuclease IV [Chloroflexota bacterium]
MKLGAHMSTAGGYYKALERASLVDCTAVQLFTKNANQWAGKVLTEDEAGLFKQTRDNLGYAPGDIIAHDSYLINLATPDDVLWEKSLAAFGHELDRCSMLGIPGLVTHAGAHMGSGEEAGLERIAQSLERVLGARTDGDVTVLLETTAGQGTCLCYCFEHLARVMELLSAPARRHVAVCWDTCHLFASGIDFTDAVKYERMVESFDRIVGLDKLWAIHMNDSKKGLGSRVDRHDHIGKGAIGIEPFRFIMNDPRLSGLPKVLETPKGDDKKDELAEDRVNLALLRGLTLLSAA